MREQRDQLDEALDDALASYCEAPETEGLERRTLARVTKRARRTRSMKLSVMAVAAAAAAVIVCLFWLATPKTPVQTRPANTTILALRKSEAPPQVRPIPVPEPAFVPANAAKPRKIRKKPTEPKLPQFPTPAPLTSEERALIQLATRDAKDVPRELTYFGGPVKPIRITAIDIKPLRLEWDAKEKRCCDR
jgi:type IV secretory pathway VirB10-like protein